MKNYINYYYGLSDTTEYPIVRWNPLVPKNTGAKVMPPEEYEVYLEKHSLSGKWDENANGDAWVKGVN